MGTQLSSSAKRHLFSSPSYTFGNKGMAGATGLEPAASYVTGRHLSSSVNSLLVDPSEFSSECPQRFHSVFAKVEATIEALSGEARRTSVAWHLLSS